MSTLLLAEQKRKTFLENLENGFVSIDSSSYTNISCPRQAFLSYILKLVPSGGRSPLIFGHMLHEVLEWMLKNGSVEKISVQEFNEKVREVIQLEGAKLNECFDDKRNTETFSSLCSAYYFNVKASGERMKPITLNGELLVEKSFSLPLGEITVLDSSGNSKTVTVLWEGKMDLIGEDAHNGELCVWDHKTTSMMGPKFLDDKMRGPQFNGYLWAGQQMTKSLDRPLNTVGINAICSKKTGVEFSIMKFKRPQPIIEEWRLSTLSVIERLMHTILPHVYNNTLPLGDFNHCCPKFGKCVFFQVCEAPESARLNYLNEPSMYSVSNWSALGEEV